MVETPTIGRVPFRTASEWMSASSDLEKQAIALDIAGSIDSLRLLITVTDHVLAIDLGLLRIPTLMQDMREFLHDDADPFAAGEGTSTKFSEE